MSLSGFGVSATVGAPTFTLYSSANTVLGKSSVWSADPNLTVGWDTVFSLVGAFQLLPGSDEGVLLIPLNPGAYTAVFSGSGAGTILCEGYVLPF